LGLAGLGRRHIRELSGGQQQRVFLARALIGEPDVLLLDEPTASVDVKTRDDILHLLAELNRQGITIVMTTHELNAVAAHLPFVVCVNGGIVAQGAPQAVFTEAILSRTFAADMRVVRDVETGGLLIAEAGRHGPFGAGHAAAAPQAIATPTPDEFPRHGWQSAWQPVAEPASEPEPEPEPALTSAGRWDQRP
ncbi:MAG: ATP-binding cassette domain-containing protein, partial [Thermomicrobiales bacterium]